jgi:hypothetical protein
LDCRSNGGFFLLGQVVLGLDWNCGTNRANGKGDDQRQYKPGTSY